MTFTTVVNPATEEAVADVRHVSLHETDSAIKKARKAFETWRSVAPADRGRLLRRFAETVDANREELARIEVSNSGHTLGNARWKRGTCETFSITIQLLPNGSSDARSRYPAASTSRSRSHLA